MSNKRAKGPRNRPRPASPHQPAKKKFPVLPVVFVVLAVALVAAIAFTGGESLDDDERVAAASGTPQLIGDSLPLHINGAPDNSVGQTAPTVTGQDFADAAVSIDPDGTPTAVMFLAHWCGHCQAEVPRVQQWLETTGGVEGVDFVSVATAYDPARGNWSPQDWLEDEGWTVPIIRDDAASSIHTAYGAGGFPYWVFLNGDGTVAFRASGEMGIAQIEAFFLALAAG